MAKAKIEVSHQVIWAY